MLRSAFAIKLGNVRFTVEMNEPMTMKVLM